MPRTERGGREDMRVKEIAYGRKFNIARGDNKKDYTEEIRLVADVDLAEDYEDAFKNLKAAVLKLYSEGQALDQGKQIVDAEPKIDQVKKTFSQEWLDRLSFSVDEKGEYIIIKPTHYLGSDYFSQLAGIIRDTLRGDYVSAGRDSHFRVKVSDVKSRA